MRKLTQVLDDDGLPVSYAKLAVMRGQSIGTIRNMLSELRKRSSMDVIHVRDLPSVRHARNQIVDERDRPISRSDAANQLGVSRMKVIRLIEQLRWHDANIRAGAPITLRTLAHNITVGGKIMLWNEPVPPSEVRKVS